ncbi:hypothetical protein D9756_006063 [Leucocoprinus leucothites]|uniref:Chromatin remodeling factor mit1 n=1 Tax=Leucocoprinus leucothites TaxID=201217 RepID=A0A8H5D4I8_9AGAR|nr:hypothetical protein D9756_006063 [Leucoagaricus leucothites]
MSRTSSKPVSVISIPDSPPKTPAESINDANAPNHKPASSRGKAAFDHVAVPHLSAERKAQYKSPRESSLLVPKVDEIIGEYEQEGHLWYFARFKGGIASRYSSYVVENWLPNLLETYRNNKAAGLLASFDPNAQYIHPLDRISLKFKLPSRSESTSLSSLTVLSDGSSALTPTSSSEGEDELNEEDEIEYDDDGLPIERPTRQSRRNRSKTSEQLPFSPKKTKRVVLTVTDDDEDNARSGTKRATRSRQLKLRFKPAYKIHDDAEFGESELDESDEDNEYGSGRRRTSKGGKVGAKGKAPRKPKGPKPQYGCVRSIDDIDLDYFSDDEDRPLREHRRVCEKCHGEPSNNQLLAWKKKKGKKKKANSDEDIEDEEERLERLGGWVQCLKCCVSAHWGCMAGTQREEILKAVRERETAKWKEEHPDEDSVPPRRRDLGMQEMADFICGACSKGGICMGCMKTAVKPVNEAGKPSAPAPPPAKDGEDVSMVDHTQEKDQPTHQESTDTSDTSSRELLFRCLTCKRLAHYSHLPVPPSLPKSTPLPQIAEYYQTNTAWLCADCESYRYPLDKIIAWRPYPPNAVEPPRPKDEIPNYKERLPREYLVKWQGRSYRRLNWVPHMWIVSTNASKLKNFLSGGTKVELLDEPVKDDNDDEKDKEKDVMFEVGVGESAGDGAVATGSRASSVRPPGVRDALPDAERYIPPAWKTIDRVLDVVIWAPKNKSNKNKKKADRKSARKQIVTTDEEDEEDETEEAKEFKRMVFEEGELVSLDNTETAEQWEERTGETISMKLMDRVIWAFIKWDDLGYDEASWDSLPRPGEKGYDAYKRAFERYVFSRNVEIPKLSAAHIKRFDNRTKDEYRKKHALDDAADLQLGQAPGLKLMPFQVTGFNWLCDNWWNHQPCILADEMGLGKTVQVATFLGSIAQKFKAIPALVVVPNSTITNWVREFERWAPNLRVVPFYGEKKARDVIKSFELFHKSHLSTNTPAKFHVLVTTYENITGRDFTTVFKNQDRWEVLIVDEGQRLKSDASLLFRKLNELRSNHRVIMTGTPLNNNIRELFNLMNFLDPKEWSDLEGLEKEYAVLNEDSIKELHNRLRPYFLRRIKSEVLTLPAKNEVIVPVSMTPLQKEVFQSIYTHNLNLLNGLTQKSLGNIKGKLNNVLMHMRKCLQHPYLYSQDIEPKGLSKEEAHAKLIYGSAKLRLLKSLLPQLKERGHRVLLFSQFVIALDIIEDFLAGEGLKYLRLDGSTKGTERQKGMDEFNKPGSDVFVYLLTTRAGGVGINLFSADTVIIFDPDFNPHQDLQAIARAYRYGQKKTCLVFKLMVKDSPEDRIMQIGKKKLVLDHLIVQKMDQDDDGAGEDIQSILTYGAQKLFDESDSARDITYSDQDILKLIEKTEVEGDEEDKPKEGQTFSFAKIWAADRDSLEEIEDNDQADSWATALKQIEAERAKEVAKAEAESGRGRRKAAAVAKRKMGANDMPEGEQLAKKPKKAKKGSRSDASGSAYTGSDGEESIDDSSDVAMGDALQDDDDIELPPYLRHRIPPVQDSTDVNFVPPLPKPKAKHKLPKPKPIQECGLCGERHGEGECYMTHSSENLRDYREILILHADDEPWEVRSAAIRVIDEVLYSRGHLSLIAGQPLHPMKPQPANPNPALSKPTFINNAAPVRQHVQEPLAQPQPQQASRQFQFVQPQTMPEVPKTSSSSSSSSRPAIATMSSSSRQISTPAAIPVKKSKGYDNGDIKCPVCETSPTHLVKDCPAVLAGSKSISRQIERLEQIGGKGDVADILRKLLRKAKFREMEMQVD